LVLHPSLGAGLIEVGGVELATMIYTETA
jgi:hypothetical protein